MTPKLKNIVLYLFQVCVAAFLYYMVARLSLVLAFENTNASPAWPPSAIGFALILFFGYRLWPGIALGAFAANISTFLTNQTMIPETAAVISALIALGNSLEAIIGVYLVRRFCGTRDPFNKVIDVYRFILTVFLMCLVSSGIGPLTLLLFEIVSLDIYFKVWFTWWLGDMTGIFIFAPILFAWHNRKFSIKIDEHNQSFYLPFVVGATFISNFLIFGGKTAWSIHNFEIAFILFPLIVLIAFFNTKFLLGLMLIYTSGFSMWGTIQGYGPFVREDLITSMLLLQIFTGVLSITGILLFAVVKERQNALMKLKKINKDLIGARRKAQEAAKAKAYLAAIVCDSDDAIISKTLDGTISSWNQGAERIYGYTAKEAVGQHIHLIAPNKQKEEEINRIIKDIRSNESIDRFETQRKTKEGAIIDVSLTISPLHDEHNNLIGASTIARDITRHKQAEEDLKEYMEKVKESNKSLEQFAFVASHDLQEPLRIVSNYTHLLSQKYAEKIDATADKYIRYITTNIERMQTMITSLLEYSRVGNEELPQEQFDTGEVCDQIISDLENDLQKRTSKITRDALPVITGHRIDFYRLMQNLITNGLKYCDKEHPSIHIHAKEEKSYWIFTVHDNGIGIEEQYTTQIFEVYKRLHSKGTYSGAGMGLAICKKIVDKYNGRIWVESTPGEGSAFHFSLLKNESATEKPSRPIHVLLVEDNPGDVLLLQESLKESEFKVRLSVVENGEDALKFLRHQEPYSDAPAPEFLILDLNLPGQSGHDVLSEIKTDPKLKTLPIVILSKSRAPDDILTSYNRYTNCYVCKPYEYENYTHVVNEIQNFWFNTAQIPLQDNKEKRKHAIYKK